MKKIFLVAVPIGLAVLAVALLSSGARERAEAYEARLERARLKRDFSERAGAARTLPADRLPEWRDEVAALSRWYFDELQAIRNRHPDEPARPNAVEAASDRKGKLDAQARAQLEDFQRYADGRLALLREGRYAPVQSMIAEGLRLDLLAVEPGSPPEGGAPGLRIDFALWGAPRFLEREKGGERTTLVRNVVPVSFRRMAFHFLAADGKPYGEMSGGGEPYQKLSDPERFADDFPSGVLFGTWFVELFPREATDVRLELQTDVRGASGAVRPVAFQAQLPVPEAWKLPPGAAFQAEVREAAAPMP